MHQGYASEKTRPLRRDAERNRLLILHAARTVFAQRGLEATLDEVAREAGLGVGTVYRRFPNREALIDALFDDGVSEIVRIVEEAEAEPRAWDGLRHFMTSLLEMQTADRGLRDVMHSRRSPKPEHDVLRAHLKPPLESLVRRAKEQGDLRKDLTATDVGVLEVAVLGAAEFTAIAAPGAWQRFLAIVLDGMRAQREPSPAEPLPAPPLDDEQIDACMVGWKYGSREIPRETPRQRAKPGCVGRQGVDGEGGAGTRACGEGGNGGEVAESCGDAIVTAGGGRVGAVAVDSEAAVSAEPRIASGKGVDAGEVAGEGPSRTPGVAGSAGPPSPPRTPSPADHPEPLPQPTPPSP